MSRSKSEIPRRADAYAAGQIRTGEHAVYDRAALATGWRDGYAAALRDARKIWNKLGGGRATAMAELLKPRRQK